ncbi:MAG TPA: vWA domain-containing protein, partial [Polyangiaceae bacterium]
MGCLLGCGPIVVDDSGSGGRAVGENRDMGGASTDGGESGTGGGSTSGLSGSAGALVIDTSSGGSTIAIPPGTGGMIESGGEAGAGGERVDLELGAGDLTMLVVFDKSGSMAAGWDQRSKWQVANEAFMKAIADVLDNLTIGAIFFPIPGDCTVAELDSGLQLAFEPGRTFLSTWQEDATRAPDGSTPLELALRTADVAVSRARELGLLEDRFRVVLVTDGEPTCGDDAAAMVALAGSWFELGVETWVMGLPGSAGATELLDAIAKAGGTEKHQSLGTPSELD